MKIVQFILKMSVSRGSPCICLVQESSYVFSYSVAPESVVNLRTATFVFVLIAFLSGNTFFVSSMNVFYDTVSLPGRPASWSSGQGL